ncbi:hypothetical protein Tco_0134837, partial [Tanacetum coccineum]
MTAPLISISFDSSDESVGSSISRVILFGSIPIKVLVVPEVGAAVVASPARVLELDIYSSSEFGPSEGSLPHVSVALMVSHFLFSDDSESDTELPKRHHHLPKIIPLTTMCAPPEVRRRRAVLIRPGQDIPVGSSLDYSSSDRSPADHSSSGHSTSDHTLYGHTSLVTTISIHLHHLSRLCVSYHLLGLHWVARPFAIRDQPHYSTLYLCVVLKQ